MNFDVTGYSGPPVPFWVRGGASLAVDVGDVPSRTESAAEQLEALIEYLRSSYEITAEALKFLERNTDIAWTLIDARPALEYSFGPAIVSLEVVRELEDEAAQERLSASIASPLSLDDALAALEQFDEEWLLHHLQLISARLDFDLKF